MVPATPAGSRGTSSPFHNPSDDTDVTQQLFFAGQGAEQGENDGLNSPPGVLSHDTSPDASSDAPESPVEEQDTAMDEAQSVQREEGSVVVDAPVRRVWVTTLPNMASSDSPMVASSKDRTEPISSPIDFTTPLCQLLNSQLLCPQEQMLGKMKHNLYTNQKPLLQIIEKTQGGMEVLPTLLIHLWGLALSVTKESLIHEPASCYRQQVSCFRGEMGERL